ncbi:MAG: TIR domain-containing protein [Chloroflexi bacterium]|nr:TIR domain-containing protein [Chloroflexota bacterium]
MNVLNIFVSYSRLNAKSVKRLVHDLQVLGHEVWFDQQITGGREWWIDILDRIRACDVFVCSITCESLNSVACMRELEYALSLKKQVLPVLMSKGVDRTLPVSLKMIQYEWYHKRTIEGYQRLITAIRYMQPNLPLPNPLPASPEAPISPLEKITERLNSAEPIDRDEQTNLIAGLKNLVKQWTTAREARQELRRLQARDEILATAEHQVVEMLSQRCLWEFKGHTKIVRSVCYNSRGTQLLTASLDGTIRIWDLTSGHELWKEHLTPQGVYSASYSPDGGTIVIAAADGTMRLRSASGRKRDREFNAHFGGALSASFDPKGQLIVTAGADGTAKVWDAREKAERFQLIGHLGTIYSACFSPRGTRIVTASADGTARIWNAQSGEMLHKLNGTAQRFNSASFSPLGEQIVTASADGLVRIWDSESGTELQTLNAQAGPVNSAFFSHSGELIVSTHADRKVRLWHVKSKTELLAFDSHNSPITTAIFSLDDDLIVTASHDKTVRLWDIYDVVQAI